MTGFTRILPGAFAALVILGCCLSCGNSRKVTALVAENAQMSIRLPKENNAPPQLDSMVKDRPQEPAITIVEDDGDTLQIFRAVENEEGELVASEVLEASVITARFRNIAERRGEVDLEYQIVVPEKMQDSEWQLRFKPTMIVLGGTPKAVMDSSSLKDVIISGKNFKAGQMRGYQRYNEWLSKIVTDTTEFVMKNRIEIFVERYLPDMWSFRNDSSFVTADEFNLAYGITDKELLEHYTRKLSRSRNKKRIASKEEKFHQLVKTPYAVDVKLDTVLQNVNGDFVYNYVQTIATRPKLRQVDIVLDGEVWGGGERLLYSAPRCAALSFYISSLSAFVDTTTRYKLQIIHRKAAANTSCNIVFKSASSRIDPSLENNAAELSRIKKTIASLIENDTFDLDSIVIGAYASPEGNENYNDKLSEKRAAAISQYFMAFKDNYRDSVLAERGYFIDESAGEGTLKDASDQLMDFGFKSFSGGENWNMLDALVRKDTLMEAGGYREQYFRIAEEFPDHDRRERRLRREPYYDYLKEKVYPQLRVVNFDFKLFRKGMVKDTIHTTVVDSAYMNAVQSIKDMDYKTAIEALRNDYPNDYNLAVAYSAMGYDASALSILEAIPESGRTAQINYMLAVIYARKNDPQMAVPLYLKSCRQDPSYVNRGNLDPEISALIKQYGLNKQEEEDDFGDFL